ncbi:hypothetical protein B9Z55_028183 [Caenorhabditis nigoni]|uniref:Uncharacterized protein n=1 Tax=Caenorhabditis nigoni TaxID=1611254 RepID=A0A2G5SCM5_9PELO|nr:hypothetical protein B9Z55_028183 [Caenorhabditis nigoni]
MFPKIGTCQAYDGNSKQRNRFSQNGQKAFRVLNGLFGTKRSLFKKIKEKELKQLLDDCQQKEKKVELLEGKIKDIVKDKETAEKAQNCLVQEILRLQSTAKNLEGDLTEARHLNTELQLCNTKLNYASQATTKNNHFARKHNKSLQKRLDYAILGIHHHKNGSGSPSVQGGIGKTSSSKKEWMRRAAYCHGERQCNKSRVPRKKARCVDLESNPRVIREKDHQPPDLPKKFQAIFLNILYLDSSQMPTAGNFRAGPERGVSYTRSRSRDSGDGGMRLREMPSTQSSETAGSDKKGLGAYKLSCNCDRVDVDVVEDSDMSEERIMEEQEHVEVPFNIFDRSISPERTAAYCHGERQCRKFRVPRKKVRLHIHKKLRKWVKFSGCVDQESYSRVMRKEDYQPPDLPNSQSSIFPSPPSSFLNQLSFSSKWNGRKVGSSFRKTIMPKIPDSNLIHIRLCGIH